MDTVEPGSPNKAADAQSAGKGAPIRDLREWLTRVEALGELVRVARPVSRDEEMSAIGYLLAKQDPSPAVLDNRTGVRYCAGREGVAW